MAVGAACVTSLRDMFSRDSSLVLMHLSDLCDVWEELVQCWGQGVGKMRMGKAQVLLGLVREAFKTCSYLCF